MYRKLILPILLALFNFNIQAQQIAVPRIDLMPDLPQPYLMRDWKQVARGYDSLVFNENMTGQYLPVIFFRESNVNYPNHASFGLESINQHSLDRTGPLCAKNILINDQKKIFI